MSVTIRKLRTVIDEAVKQRLQNYGITPPMGRALLALRAEGTGACSQRALADALGVTQPTMAVAVAGLARRRLVLIVGDEDDRRRNLVRLTQLGMEAAAAMEAAEAEVISRMLDGVAADDLDAALRGLAAMLTNLEPARESTWS